MTRALLVAVVALAAAASPAQASELIEITIPARNGEVPEKWLPGYTGDPRAKVLLPDGYDAKKAYPLVVLFAGLNSTYRFWSDTDKGDIKRIAAGLDAIIVMPEGGDGWYADWWNGGKRGAPSWESYQLDQVIPQIEERFRIRPERRYHALMGVSMGGLGAAFIGGRLPGYFGSVTVISGLVDIQLIPGTANVMSLIATGKKLEPSFSRVVGSPSGFYATGHNPAKLAANLAQTRVYMSSGNGMPCADSTTGANVPSDLASELAIIKPASDSFAAALTRAGVDVTYQPHCGYHDWPNFQAQVRDAIRWGLFHPVEKRPSSWVNDTVATHGRIFDVAYSFAPAPDGIVRFRRRGTRLLVSGAHTTATLRIGRCVLRAALPADLVLPVRSKRCRPSRSFRHAPRH